MGRVSRLFQATGLSYFQNERRDLEVKTWVLTLFFFFSLFSFMTTGWWKAVACIYKERNKISFSKFLKFYLSIRFCSIEICSDTLCLLPFVCFILVFVLQFAVFSIPLKCLNLHSLASLGRHICLDQTIRQHRNFIFLFIFSLWHWAVNLMS